MSREKGLLAPAPVSQDMHSISVDSTCQVIILWLAGIKYGDESKSVDKFCEDYRNVRMPLVNALGIVLIDIAGRPPIDGKTLRILRCQAAAGNDENKLRDCESQL